MPRSASTFAFQLTLSALDSLKESGIYLNRTTSDLLTSFGIPFQGDGYIHDTSSLDRAVELLLSKNIEHLPFAIVLKSHCRCSSRLTELLTQKKVFASAIYRDPLEIAYSLINICALEKKTSINRFNMYTEILDTIDGIKDSISSLYSWTQTDSVICISFTELTANSRSYLLALEAQLEHQLDTEYIASWFEEDISIRVGEYVNKELVAFLEKPTLASIQQFNESFNDYYAWINSRVTRLTTLHLDSGS